jgi:hypothetical protein
MFASVAKLQVGIAKNKTNQIMLGLTIRMAGASVPMHRCGPATFASRWIIHRPLFQQLPNTAARYWEALFMHAPVVKKCMSAIMQAIYFFSSKLVTLGWTKQQRIYSVKRSIRRMAGASLLPDHSDGGGKRAHASMRPRYFCKPLNISPTTFSTAT